MSASAASTRALAVEAVRRVTDEGAFSNRVMAGLLSRSLISDRDRALATELAYGSVRRLLPIDAALAPLLRRPLPEAPPTARAALRVGAYQVLFTRIPPHAAVGETVAVVAPGERGLVNAVLRRLAADPPAPPEGASDEAMSLRTGVSAWMVAELRRLVGDEVEEAAAALASPAGLSVRANPCRASLENLEGALAGAGITTERGRFHPNTLRLERGDPAALPGFADGWFSVQDEASAWVVDVLDPQRGERVLDACAGPGGKTGDLSCRSGGAVGADVSVGRIRLVREAARRLGIRVLLVAQDAAAPALRSGFDRALVDAPCSGIGAARRRPELLWRPQNRDLSRLARLQVRIALGVAGLLRPGGTLVYSVCTFPRAETDAACNALEGKAPFLEPDPFPGPDGSAAARARLWPHRHGTDAMFVARYRVSA